MKKIRPFLVGAFILALSFLSSCDIVGNLISSSSSIISSSLVSSNSSTSTSSSSSVSSSSHEHTWDEGIVTKQATCTENGEMTYNCDSCEETKIAIILAAGHKEVIDVAIEPTCTTTGLTEGSHCSVCNDVLVAQKFVSALGHDYKSVVTEATCENKGYTTHTCDRCNGSYVDSYIDALDHDYKSVITDPTCTDKGYTTHTCDRCNDSYIDSSVNPLGHTDAEAVKENEVASTCSKEGSYESVVYCSVCNEELSRNVIIADKLPHTEVVDEAIEPTCTTTGLTEGKHCSICNEILITQEKINELHTYVNGSCEICGATEGLAYTLVDDGYSVSVGETTDKTSIVIPSIYNGLPVTSISFNAFSYCDSLTSITIPESVTSIGQNAFEGCSSLESITIPDSVTSIGEGAFSGCSSLKSIIIPEGITSIGQNVFEGCSSLESITIPDSVTSIGWEAFRDCSSLESITIPNGVTSIGFYAFSGCNSLESITIPDRITSIGIDMFYGCSSLTSITIPDRVTIIYAEAFSGCSSLTSITIPKRVTSIGGWAFSGCSSLTDVYYQGTLEDWCNISFSGITSSNPMYHAKHLYMLDNNEYYEVTEIEIPNTITTIGDYQFCGFNSVTSITIPDSVTSIGEDAFSGCSSLKSIIIPEGITSIETGAFGECSSLTNITIPNSVTSIGWCAFNNCSSLKTVYYTGTEEQWNSITIDSANDPLTFATITYHYGHNIVSMEAVEPTCTTIGLTEGKYCSTCEQVVVAQETIEKLGHLFNEEVFEPTETNQGYTLHSCSRRECAYHYKDNFVDPLLNFKLNSDKLSYSVTSCNLSTEQSEITIPSEYNDMPVTIIGYRAFYGAGITKISIPSSIEIIDEYAFLDCKSLQEIIFEEGIKEIRTNALGGCTALTSLELPNSLTIFNCYLSDLTSLTYIKMPSFNVSFPSNIKKIEITSAKEIKPYYFSGLSKLEEVILPNNIEMIGHYAFSSCYKLVKVNFEDLSDLQYIDSYAFSECSRLTTIDLTNCLYSLTIESNAFSSCILLESILLPNSIKSIGVNAFNNCTSLVYNEYNNAKYLGNNNYKNLYLSEIVDTSVSSFEMDENTVIIGAYSFENCNNLTQLTLSPNVLEIGIYTFSNCTKLEQIILNSKIEILRHNVFYNCNSLKYYEYNNGLYLKDAEDNLIVLVDVIDTTVSAFDIASTCKFIYSQAFYECNNIEEIDIPNGVLSIGHSAFTGCKSLSKVHIPDSVLLINNNAFSSCSNLIDVNMGSSVQYIGQYAFYMCTKLEHIKLADSLIYLGDNAFNHCYMLQSVILPKALKHIDADCFNNNTLLDCVYYEGTSSEYKQIQIGCYDLYFGSDNESLKNATIYYYTDIEPMDEGNYWYYDTDGLTPVKW